MDEKPEQNELRFTVIIPEEICSAFIAMANDEVMSHGLLARKIIVKYFRRVLQEKAMREEAALTERPGEPQQVVLTYGAKSAKQGVDLKQVHSEREEK